jgi:hypothetical protein
MADVDPESVRSREDLARFIRDLAESVRRDPATWENRDLWSFLEAMSAWVEDMEGYFKNRGEAVPASLDWKTVAAMLAAARVYE